MESLATESASKTRPVGLPRFRAIHIMGWTVIAAMFFGALFTENEWLRATLGTVTSAMVGNALLKAIFTRGEEQAFSLGYFLGAVLFIPFAYTMVASLPWLLTVRFFEFLDSIGLKQKDFNRQIMAAIFWVQVTCFSGAFTGRYWYRRTWG